MRFLLGGENESFISYGSLLNFICFKFNTVPECFGHMGDGTLSICSNKESVGYHDAGFSLLYEDYPF